MLEQKETKIQEQTIAFTRSTQHRVYSFLTRHSERIFFVAIKLLANAFSFYSEIAVMNAIRNNFAEQYIG